MKSWSITQARANISELFDAALSEGPQKIERRDSEPVVMVAESDWNRLVSAYPTIADFILHAPLVTGDLPARNPGRVISKDLD